MTVKGLKEVDYRFGNQADLLSYGDLNVKISIIDVFKKMIRLAYLSLGWRLKTQASSQPCCSRFGHQHQAPRNGIGSQPGPPGGSGQLHSNSAIGV